MEQFIFFVALCVVIFVSLKFLYWINSTIFLYFLERRLPNAYWKLSIWELITSGCTALLFSYSFVFKKAGTIFPLMFIVSALAYLLYMARRVWKLSKRMH